MKNNTKIPSYVKPYLLEIANRLWSGHATIMIGAGFSKNANKNGSTSKNFPDWNKLGDVFYEKIYGNPPTNGKYLNVLKLADEVQAAFGRNTLDQILKQEIPDKEYQPSLLHEKTLQLPWTDVFTTNYDTLLERTADRILQHRYETIVNKEDLVLSTKPRIIKLHGSFPSERPFIITEEDYRKYPSEFAPFVNTVQQSLLENTLCLIGFSGDDPNFLKWIGWIRDNLGKMNAPKIYLVGVLSLSIGQKKLLDERNIVPIDLSNCKDVDGDHFKALELFIDFLNDQGKVEESLGWPQKNTYFHYSVDKDINEQVKPIIEDWKFIREKYPNWLIVPEDRRETLQLYTERSTTFLYHLLKIESPFELEFLYEFNWRSEKCLMPIYNNFIKYYENVINKYNPFPQIITLEESNDTINPQGNKILDWRGLSKIWLEIQLSMLRFYREEGFHKEWQHLSDKFMKLIPQLSSVQLANFYYERCLYYLFSLDISKVRKELSLWSTDISLPYWEAKKAGLLAELGEVIEAEKILEISLKSVRSHLNLSPVTNDYFIVSQEAYILQLLKYVKNAVSSLNGTYFIDENINKSYSERWNILKRYKCDPWAELESFRIHLDQNPGYLKNSEKKYGFNIGNVRTTYSIGSVDKYAQKAYAFLRYMEDIGVPFRLPGTTFGKESGENAVTYIANYSPSWAFASYMRLGDTKSIDSIFGRKSLAKLDRETVDELILEYLKILESTKGEIKNGDRFRNKNFAISLSTVIPEILSRLCVKCSYSVKLKLLDFLKDNFKSDFRDRYKGIGNLTERLIESFTEYEQYALVPKLLEFPVLSETNHVSDDEFIDPIQFLKIDEDNLGFIKKIKINNKKIQECISIGKGSSNARKKSITRLVILFNLGLLSNAQEKKLGNLIWSKLDKKTGFPIETIYYSFAFLMLPHPANINPEELLRTYINAEPFPIQKNKKEKSIPMYGGRIQLLINIVGTTNTGIDFTWNKKDISVLIDNIIEWWDSDKEYLIEKEEVHPFGSTSKEFKSRFDNLRYILANIIAPNYQFLSKKEEINITRVINEFPNYNIPNLEIKSAFYNVFSNKEQNVIKLELFKGIFSWSKSNVIDSINGTIQLLSISEGEPTDLIKAIGENIRSLNNTDLRGCLYLITLVINEHSNLVTVELLNNLEIGLTNLIQKSELSTEDSNEIIDKKLSIRIQTAHLTVSLYNYFKIKELDVPSYVLKWRDICLSPNEFSEIRRIWKMNDKLEK